MELTSLQNSVEKWFEIPNTNVSVLLKLPTRDELLKDYRSVQSKDGGIQDLKWFRTVATKYILGAKGIKENGADVEYTTEVGFLLMKNQMTGPFIDKMLGAAGEWLDEGNGFGGIA